MTTETLFNLIGSTEEDMIADADTVSARKKRPAWLRWGAAAACVCLLAWGGFTLAARFVHPAPAQGGGGAGGSVDVPGGSWPEGVDPKTASIAVYPATEKVQDVATAELRFLNNEEEALTYPHLGDHLPHTLPDGYWFVIAALYETTMKNGSSYHLLRATYSKSDQGNYNPEAPYLTDDCFDVQVLDYLPRTSKPVPIYTSETLKLPPGDNGIFYLAVDDVYIGVSPGTSYITGDELRRLVTELLGD